MSLSLLQSYSSDENDQDDGHGREGAHTFSDDSSLSDDGDALPSQNPSRLCRSAAPNSLLPSAFDAFSEVSGPPDFLNNSVSGSAASEDGDDGRGRRGGGRRHRKEKKDLPSGAVLEAKPQLVAIRDRVNTDNGMQLPASIPFVDAKRVISATNPEPKDAADLLRMCLQCGIPKTYSNASGMVCPQCGDRAPIDPNNTEKKKGSTIKDKEKSKRMRGQSSHATWKSETEMQLRQQFD